VFQDPAPLAPPQKEESAWRWDLIPYYWSASLGGSLAIDGQEVDIEGGGDGFFSEPALSGFLGHFEAHHGPWSYVLAPIFINAESEGGQPPTTDADLNIDAQLHEAFVARQFAPGWQWMLGLRYQKIDTDMDLSIASVPVASLDSSKEWVDPIVGVRYQHHFDESWSLYARGDIGGFGVGSDFAWNASLVGSYQFTPLFGVQLGYRALSIDFEDQGNSGELSYDLDMYGPMIGMSFSL
jgi:hypothetical protein